MTGEQRKSIALFALLAAVAGFGLTRFDEYTAERVAANQEAYALRLIGDVLPAETFDNEPHRDRVALTVADGSDDIDASQVKLGTAYRARRNGRVAAAALEVVAPDGYVGPIRLLVGIDASGTIVRVRASEHRETPGLGDKIEPAKSDWIQTFRGLSLEGTNWQLRRDGGDIDQISGATVTSRAVMRGVERALLLNQEFSETITGPGNATAGPD